ncbi:MAG: hypothetical protein ACRDID_23665, partial [Ktedonobacterales bacterium]
MQQASLIDWRWRLRASRPHILRWLLALRSQRLSEPPEPSAAPATSPAAPAADAAQAHDAPSFELFYQRHAG